MINATRLAAIALLSCTQASATGGLISGLNFSAPVQHLTINLIWDLSVIQNAAPAGFKPAITACAAQLSKLIVSNLTVNIDIGYGDILGTPSMIGLNVSSGSSSQTRPGQINTDYASVKAALVAKAKSKNALASVATLPASDPSPGGASTYALVPAQALNYGIAGGTGAPQSAWAAFGNNTAWSYNGNPSSSEIDINGACLHELTECLGRYSQYVPIAHDFSAIDLYRYSGSGARGFAGGNTYFSINNGVTNLRNFHNGNDWADWSGIDGADAFDANPTTGAPMPLSFADLVEMDVLGWSSQ